MGYSAMQAAKEMKFGAKVAYWTAMLPKCRIYAQRRESARYHDRRWKLIATRGALQWQCCGPWRSF